MTKNNSPQKNPPAYQRIQGTREPKGEKRRTITFCLSKHIVAEGQSFQEWDNLGLAANLLIRMQSAGQFTIHEVRQNKTIKEYHKVGYPPDSHFKKPMHITHDVTWAVMHITPKSKEVVAGYIEDDVFYIVFLDKDHKFWPMAKK